MGLVKTLTKVAIGYAAARGVDRLSGGKGLGGLGGLMGGKAQLQGREPGTGLQAQLGRMLGGTGTGSPFDSLMQKLPQGLPGMAQTPGGANPGMAGVLAAATGAAALGAKGVGSLIDQFNTETTLPAAEEAAGLMLRAMIQAAKADGTIDAAEKARLMDTVGEDATPEDMAFVKEQLAAPVDPEALAAATPEAQRMQVYSAALMTITVDTDEEAEFLDRLAKAMNLPETTVNALHMQMGLQPLYS